MLTLFPPMFSSPIAWSLEDHISHDQQSYANYIDTGTSESFLQVPPSQPQVDHNQYAQSTSICGDPLKVKKLNHNASERDRRKKINTLYTSLRSLLPGTDQTVLTNYYLSLPFLLLFSFGQLVGYLKETLAENRSFRPTGGERSEKH